jgi:hypothetical protein
MDDLESGLEMYEAQLAQVQQALRADKDNADLNQLNTDLRQLIALTKQNILEEKKKLLLAECDQLERTHGVEPSVVQVQRPEVVETRVEPEVVEQPPESPPSAPVDLRQLDGMKCKAPHKPRGSYTSSSLHNAMIFQTEAGAEAAASMDDIRVRVVFSHPTSTAMLPCPFYLDGKCRFSDDDCKFSHGEVVSMADLGEFEEPDYSSLEAGSAVLAKSVDTKLWTHAKVEGVEGDCVHIRFTSDHKEIKTVSRENVFPLKGDGDDFDDDDLVPLDDEEDESLFVPVDLLDRLNPDASSLGDWEEHTRGIGSKLMQAMGYVTGTGLGKKADGKVLPVTATIYPQGKSLDWCMELREKAGGGDILTVEKTLKRQAAKEDKKAKSRYIREKQREKRQNSLFDFMNTELGGGKTKSHVDDSRPGPSKPKTITPAFSLKKTKTGGSGGSSGGGSSGSSSSSANSLNVRHLQVGEEIRRTERDLASLRKTYDRHRGKEAAIANGVKRKMDETEKKLRELRGREGKLDRDRKMNQSSRKLTIF